MPVALGWDLLSDQLGAVLDLWTLRLGLLALLVAVFGYVAERERTLRELTSLLVARRRPLRARPRLDRSPPAGGRCAPALALSLG